MAKNKKSRKKTASPTSEREDALVSSSESNEHDASQTTVWNEMITSGGEATRIYRRSDAGFFSLYKPGQGYYTRLGTGIGGGLIAVFGANFIYDLLPPENVVVQMGIPFLFVLIMGAVIFWIVGLNPKANDFFISTEGEMKKVSWSNRQEVIGSTKVVLAFTLMLASLLFVVDFLFMSFFSSIGVLKLNILQSILGL